MDDCQKCKYLSECNSLNMPKEIIARIIDLIEKNSDDSVIESLLMNDFNIRVESYGYSIKMLKKYLLELEDECIEQRKESRD